jgi:hypothetical protein
MRKKQKKKKITTRICICIFIYLCIIVSANYYKGDCTTLLKPCHSIDYILTYCGESGMIYIPDGTLEVNPKTHSKKRGRKRVL